MDGLFCEAAGELVRRNGKAASAWAMRRVPARVGVPGAPRRRTGWRSGRARPAGHGGGAGRNQITQKATHACCSPPQLQSRTIICPKTELLGHRRGPTRRISAGATRENSTRARRLPKPEPTMEGGLTRNCWLSGRTTPVSLRPGVDGAVLRHRACDSSPGAGQGVPPWRSFARRGDLVAQLARQAPRTRRRRRSCDVQPPTAPTNLLGARYAPSQVCGATGRRHARLWRSCSRTLRHHPRSLPAI